MLRGDVGPVMNVGLLTPQSGPIALFGPSSINCAKLAVEEINAEGGLLGRSLSLVCGDGGGSPHSVVAETTRMIENDRIQALIGSHISPNRDALVGAIGGRIPYVYTTLYEGDQYSYGVFMCGETPFQQLRPLIRWMRANRQARKWYLIGSDYSFPRKSCSDARGYIAEADGSVVGEEYLPLYTEQFHPTLTRIRASGADAVLIYLVGTDAILFNRQFNLDGLHLTVARAAPVMCENTLLGIGMNAAGNLYSTAGFTNSLRTVMGTRFRDNYRRRFGALAPVPNRYGVSCYEGLQLLAALARQAGCLNVHKMQVVANDLSLVTPRGECHMQSNHLGATMHIVEAKGPDLCVIDTVGYRAAASKSVTIHPQTVGGHA